jgi:hypothetical protein
MCGETLGFRAIGAARPEIIRACGVVVHGGVKAGRILLPTEWSQRRTGGKSFRGTTYSFPPWSWFHTRGLYTKTAGVLFPKQATLPSSRGRALLVVINSSLPGKRRASHGHSDKHSPVFTEAPRRPQIKPSPDYPTTTGETQTPGPHGTSFIKNNYALMDRTPSRIEGHQCNNLAAHGQRLPERLLGCVGLTVHLIRFSVGHFPGLDQSTADLLAHRINVHPSSDIGVVRVESDDVDVEEEGGFFQMI